MPLTRRKVIYLSKLAGFSWQVLQVSIRERTICRSEEPSAVGVFGFPLQLPGLRCPGNVVVPGIARGRNFVAHVISKLGFPR